MLREWSLNRQYAPIRTIRLLFALLVILLAACAQPATTTPPSTDTPQPPTVTAYPPTHTPTATQTEQPTATATPLPCNPAAADYCIVEGTFLLRRPIAAPGSEAIDPGYTYGSTLRGAREPHHGVEFPNASGTPVLAAADGTVVYAGDDTAEKFSPWNNFYGNLVILQHDLPGQTLYTLYAHLSKLDVSAGQQVTAGEKIGEVGMSGSAIGSHLHFEVRLDPHDYDSTLNPQLWLSPLPGTGVLSMRFVDADGRFVQAQPNVQYFPDPNAAFARSWFPENYDPSMPAGSWENALLGDLPAGRYRVIYIWAGVVHDRWLEIQPGKLTLVSFEVP